MNSTRTRQGSTCPSSCTASTGRDTPGAIPSIPSTWTAKGCNQRNTTLLSNGLHLRRDDLFTILKGHFAADVADQGEPPLTRQALRPVGMQQTQLAGAAGHRAIAGLLLFTGVDTLPAALGINVLGIVVHVHRYGVFRLVVTARPGADKNAPLLVEPGFTCQVDYLLSA